MMIYLLDHTTEGMRFVKASDPREAASLAGFTIKGGGTLEDNLLVWPAREVATGNFNENSDPQEYCNDQFLDDPADFPFWSYNVTRDWP